MQYAYDCNYCYIGDDSDLERHLSIQITWNKTYKLWKKKNNKLLKNVDFNKLIIL